MDEAPVRSSAVGSDKSLMAALIVIARYLDGGDPGFEGYLSASIEHARAAGLSSDDLKALRMIAASVGKSKSAGVRPRR